MKKIITLLFCAAMASSSFAQTTKTASHKTVAAKRTTKKYVTDKKVADVQTVYNTDPRELRDEELQKINYINNMQVQQVVNNKDLGIWEKKDALDALEFKRIQQANVVYQKYSDSVTAYTAQQINRSFSRH